MVFTQYAYGSKYEWHKNWISIKYRVYAKQLECIYLKQQTAVRNRIYFISDFLIAFLNSQWSFAAMLLQNKGDDLFKFFAYIFWLVFFLLENMAIRIIRKIRERGEYFNRQIW